MHHPKRIERWNHPISLPQLLIVIGAAEIIVSLFLKWVDIHVSVGQISFKQTGTATFVPVQFLFDRHASGSDPTILAVLIPAAALGVLGALIHQKILTFVAGGVALFVPGMYAYQVDTGLGELNQQRRGSFFLHFELNDVMGLAPYICGLGAVIMLIGAFLLDRAATRGRRVLERAA